MKRGEIRGGKKNNSIKNSTYRFDVVRVLLDLNVVLVVNLVRMFLLVVSFDCQDFQYHSLWWWWKR